jgi:predicted site-specific integrase-resolvase
MIYLSTTQAAKKLGLAHNTLAQYIRVGKVPAPKAVTSGGTSVHLWTEEEIEAVRKLLPKIANGRKTRYQRLREKEQKAPAGVPAPHKKKQTKKKK